LTRPPGKRCPKSSPSRNGKSGSRSNYAALEADDAALEKKREQAGLTVARKAVN
jgi:hypothetical protein